MHDHARKRATTALPRPAEPRDEQPALRIARSALPASAREVVPVDDHGWSFGAAVNAGLVQRDVDPHLPEAERAPQPTDAGPEAERAIGAARGASSGQELPEALRHRFEDSLGHDLSGVRVHTGDPAAAAARSVGARAYALGQDVYMGAGHYAPDSHDGQHLLAHEVAHTVQQRGAIAAPQYKLETSSPGDAMETEADRAADAMVRGQPARIAGSAGPTIAREAVGEREARAIARSEGSMGELTDIPQRATPANPTLDTTRVIRYIESQIAAAGFQMRITDPSEIDGIGTNLRTRDVPFVAEGSGAQARGRIRVRMRRLGQSSAGTHDVHQQSGTARAGGEAHASAGTENTQSSEGGARARRTSLPFDTRSGSRWRSSHTHRQQGQAQAGAGAQAEVHGEASTMRMNVDNIQAEIVGVIEFTITTSSGRFAPIERSNLQHSLGTATMTVNTGAAQQP